VYVLEWVPEFPENHYLTRSIERSKLQPSAPWRTTIYLPGIFPLEITIQHAGKAQEHRFIDEIKEFWSMYVEASAHSAYMPLKVATPCHAHHFPDLVG
jgi:hypothetical protein